MNPKIVFIGAGNLATQLSKTMQSCGFEIIQVYSRSKESAEELAGLLSTRYTINLNEIEPNADVYLVALKDSVVNEVLSQIDFNDKLLVHCSGSLPLSVLEKHSDNIGVFYPLQTFSKARSVNFNEIPLFLESNKTENLEFLQSIAFKISDKVLEMSSEKRKMLHVSAVFACNFVNYLYTVADNLLQTKDIQFDVLKPLILETAKKVQEMEPEKAQTGPAVRFDENVINAHLSELKENANYQELYKLISKQIFEYYNK